MCQNGVQIKETTVKISNAIVGVCLSAMACSASALSLGSSRGAVILGAPVDLTFEVTPDPGSDVASSCISAKLVSGSTPVADSKVQVTPVTGAGTPRVRVRAFISADEPVLTATLTGGCAGQITRQYTFLAELPEAASAAAAAGSRPVDLGRLSPAARPGLAGEGAGTSRAAVAAGADAPSSGAGATPRPAPAPAPAIPRRPRPPAAEATPPAASRAAAPRTRVAAPVAAEPARPRLVMEPLELWLESPLVLRSSQALPAPAATASDAQRAEAAALWRALNTPPEEVQKAAGRITQLEADAAGQRAQAGAERAAAADLRQRLETVESQSFSSTIVYALVALLLAALALAFWIWSRSRRAVNDAWTQSVQANSRPPDGVILDGAQGAESLHTNPLPADHWEAPAPQRAAPVAAPAPLAAPVSREPVVPATPAPLATPSFSPSSAAGVAAAAVAAVGRPAPPRQGAEVHPEALFDVQQQAEFFVSVGEHDQAIGVLQSYIEAHGNTSPSAYLELLRLYHTLSRAEAFNQLSSRFQALFNARVPEFSAFHRAGRTLLEYTETLAHIESIWSTAEVDGLIESCVFRTEGGACADPFDLAAFDDLLLLLAIAQTTPAQSRGAPPPRERTTPQAQAVVPVAVAAAAKPFDAVDMLPDVSFDSMVGDLSLAPRRPQPPARGLVVNSFDLDLDLSEPPPITTSDLPPLPVTPPPAPGQPVGFGSASDRFEVRLELEEWDKRKPE